jgi:hypothetical protein
VAVVEVLEPLAVLQLQRLPAQVVQVILGHSQQIHMLAVAVVAVKLAQLVLEVQVAEVLVV